MRKLTKYVLLLAAMALGFAFASCKHDIPNDTPEVKYYTVTFDSNGGTEVKSQKIESGKKATEPETNPTKEGYGFAGWYNGETVFDFDTAIKADITLKAKWTLNTYTISFNTNGGNPASIDFQVIEYGNTATKPADPTKTATEAETYTFAGWFTSTDNGTTLSDTAFDFNTAITSDIKLFAKWTEKAVTHTVSFNTNGGTPTSITSQNIDHGKLATRPANPTKTATEAETYTFAGWYISTENGETTFDFNTPITKDITLYAKWTATVVTHTVSFNTKGGNPANIDSQTIEYGNKVSKPADPTKTATETETYTFAGWYISTDNGETEFDFETEIKKDITIYAKWNSKPLYKVSYTTEYGTTPSTITVEENSILTDNQLPKLSYYDGYTFNGWYDDNTEALPKKYMVTKNVTLTAKWDVPKAIPLKNCDTIHDLFFKLAGSEPHPWIGGWTINKTVTRFVKSTTKPENVLYYLDKGEKEVPLWYDESVTTLYYYIPEGRALGLTVSREGNGNELFKSMQKLEYIDTCDFDTSNVTDMSDMFTDCLSLTELDVSNFDTSNVTKMSRMFYGCSALTELDVSNFDTSNVTRMGSMFDDCKALTSLDVSNFDTSNVTTMYNMFYRCSLLTTIFASDKFVTNAVTDSTEMFNYCTKLKGGAGTKYDRDKIDKEYARIDGGTENPGYFTLKQ